MEEVVMLLMVVGDAVSSFLIYLCGLCPIAIRFCQVLPPSYTS